MISPISYTDSILFYTAHKPEVRKHNALRKVDKICSENSLIFPYSLVFPALKHWKLMNIYCFHYHTLLRRYFNCAVRCRRLQFSSWVFAMTWRGSTGLTLFFSILPYHAYAGRPLSTFIWFLCEFHLIIHLALIKQLHSLSSKGFLTPKRSP